MPEPMKLNLWIVALYAGKSTLEESPSAPVDVVGANMHKLICAQS